MSLRGEDVVLLHGAAVLEIVVGGVKGDACIKIDRPGIERFGEAEFGFERPAIRSDVHEPSGIVLAVGRSDLEARTDDQILMVVPELLPATPRVRRRN